MLEFLARVLVHVPGKGDVTTGIAAGMPIALAGCDGRPSAQVLQGANVRQVIGAAGSQYTQSAITLDSQAFVHHVERGRGGARVQH